MLCELLEARGDCYQKFTSFQGNWQRCVVQGGQSSSKALEEQTGGCSQQGFPAWGHQDGPRTF